MKKVLIEFVRQGAQRETEVVYATIELDDAIFVHVRRFTQGNLLLEEVSLTYRKIAIGSRDKTIVSVDNW